MPTVEIVAGSASVKVESGEMGAAALLEVALDGLKRAHQIEQEASKARAERAGGAYV